MLALTAFGRDGDTEAVHGSKPEVKVKEPEVLIGWSVREACSITRSTGRQQPSFLSISSGRLVELVKAGVLHFFDNAALEVLQGGGRRRGKGERVGVGRARDDT